MKDYILSKTKKNIYPPVKTWSSDLHLTPNDKMCGIAEMFGSKVVQEKLLEVSTDIVFVPYDLGDWIHECAEVYIKLPTEIMSKVNALPTKQKENLFSKYRNTFISDYIYLGCLDEGCPKRGLKSYFSADGRLKQLSEHFLDREKYYELFEHQCRSDWGNFVGKDKDLVKSVSDSIFDYITTFWDKVNELYDLAFNTMVDAYAFEEAEKVRKAKEAEDKAKAEFQSYLDWINNGNPVYYRYGLAYRGARLTKYSIAEALERLNKEKPFEYIWSEVNGTKSLILQYYSANDMW